MQLDAYGRSITGRRSNNEDAICASPELGMFIIADGMGGYEGGAVASALAVDTSHDRVRKTASDADTTWPYRIGPARSLPEKELIVDPSRWRSDRRAT
jgi:serine/threonine protein phosphatase PrpC